MAKLTVPFNGGSGGNNADLEIVKDKVDAMEDDVEDLQDKMSLVYARTNAYMEIKNSLGTIDIAVSDWVENTGDTDYPYNWELTNGYLEGAVNCIVVYSKDSDTSMLCATTGIDEVNSKLIIYASELPTETISIEKIAVFNDLDAYINYSNEIVQQVLQNTQAISDINNTKLPQYVKGEEENTPSGWNFAVQSLIGRKATTGGLQFKTTRKNTTDYSEIAMPYGAVRLGVNNNGTENVSRLDKDGLEITIGQNVLTLQNGEFSVVLGDNTNNYTISLTNTGDFAIQSYENGGGTTHSLTFDANGDLKIDGNAVGDKQLYQHNITINHTDGGLGNISLQIINDSNVAFTLSTLWDYLVEHYSTDDSSAKKGLSCNGLFYFNSTTYLCVNIHYNSVSDFIRVGCVQINGNYSNISNLNFSFNSSQASMTDSIVAL